MQTADRETRQRVLGKPLFSVSNWFTISWLVWSVTEGDHGYNNSLPDMHPYFMAMGPAFKVKHTVKTFKNVDVYPLICKILGIQPAPNNGSLEIVQNLLKPVHQDNGSASNNTFLVCKYTNTLNIAWCLPIEYLVLLRALIL